MVQKADCLACFSFMDCRQNLWGVSLLQELSPSCRCGSICHEWDDPLHNAIVIHNKIAFW